MPDQTKDAGARRAKRVQFSVYMDAEVKEKLETLASIRQVSLNQLLEQLGRDEIQSIDPATWQTIKNLKKKISK